MKKFTVRFLEDGEENVLKVEGEVLRVLDEGDETGTLSFTVDGFLHEERGVLLEVTRTVEAFGYSTEKRVY